MITLNDWIMIFPKGSENTVQLSGSNPGPLPCPSGDIISPFGCFPDPAPGMKRRYRLKGVIYDENIPGTSNVKVQFNLFDGKQVTFTFPQCASAQNASNFRYSDWYHFGSGSPEEIDRSHAHVTASFATTTNKHGGIFALFLEAHDF